MKKYKNADAAFIDEIDIYEHTDPSDADSVDNVPLIQLYGNTVALKRELAEKAEGLAEGVSGAYAFVDQVLAAAILSYQRLARIMAFQYDPGKEAISTWGGASCYGETIALLEGVYDQENEAIRVQADQGFDFGADGFLYCRSKEAVIGLPGAYLDGETLVFGEGLAEMGEGETIRLRSPDGARWDGQGGSGGSHYVLPVATATRLGGVMIGAGIRSQADGTISVDAASSAEAAAEIVEANATSPSDSDIDSLFK